GWPRPSRSTAWLSSWDTIHLTQHSVTYAELSRTSSTRSRQSRGAEVDERDAERKCDAEGPHPCVPTGAIATARKSIRRHLHSWPAPHLLSAVSRRADGS